MIPSHSEAVNDLLCLIKGEHGEVLHNNKEEVTGRSQKGGRGNAPKLLLAFF